MDGSGRLRMRRIRPKGAMRDATPIVPELSKSWFRFAGGEANFWRYFALQSAFRMRS